MEQESARLRDVLPQHRISVSPLDMMLLATFATLGTDVATLWFAENDEHIARSDVDKMRAVLNKRCHAIGELMKRYQSDDPQLMRMAATLLQIINDRYRTYVVGGM